MTIILTFEAPAAPKRLFNVDAVEDRGMRSVGVRMTFGEPQVYHHVTHVALELEMPEDDDVSDDEAFGAL